MFTAVLKAWRWIGAPMRLGSVDKAAQQRGFGLLFAMLAVAALAAGSLAIATNWTQQIEREKEAELLRIGDLYARAIASYYYSTPGQAKRFPKELNELLEDRRFLTTRRHLRDAYADPITGGDAWNLVTAPDGGIMGVYSASSKAPWLKIAVTLDHTSLSAAQQYSDWKFIPKSL